MAIATKNGRPGNKKNPVTLSRDEVIARIRKLGGEIEVERYKSVEKIEKLHGQHDVLDRWKVGNYLKVSFKEHDEEAVQIYSVGLQRSTQLLRLSARLAEMYDQPELVKLLDTAAKAKHELNWAHFRQLLREELTAVQRADMAARTISNRWGYRELQAAITARFGKKSKGGRKPGKTKYKTYAQALSAMKLRSEAWLSLDAGWIDQVKSLVCSLGEDEKLTQEFITLTNNAAALLRKVAYKAAGDADDAEAIVIEVSRAMGNPDLQLEEVDQESVQPTSNGAPKPNGVHKVRAKVKSSKRIRLAKHPRMQSVT